MHMPNTHKRMEIDKMLLNVFKSNPINRIWSRKLQTKQVTPRNMHALTPPQSAGGFKQIRRTRSFWLK